MNNVNVSFKGETKLGSLSLDGQFLIDGYNKPLGLDVSGRSMGLLVFAKSLLPTKQLTKLKILMNVQVIMLELNLPKEKWEWYQHTNFPLKAKLTFLTGYLKLLTYIVLHKRSKFYLDTLI